MAHALTYHQVQKKKSLTARISNKGDLIFYICEKHSNKSKTKGNGYTFKTCYLLVQAHDKHKNKP